MDIALTNCVAETFPVHFLSKSMKKSWIEALRKHAILHLVKTKTSRTVVGFRFAFGRHDVSGAAGRAGVSERVTM